MYFVLIKQAYFTIYCYGVRFVVYARIWQLNFLLCLIPPLLCEVLDVNDVPRVRVIFLTNEVAK